MSLELTSSDKPAEEVEDNREFDSICEQPAVSDDSGDSSPVDDHLVKKGPNANHVVTDNDTSRKKKFILNRLSKVEKVDIEDIGLIEKIMN